MFITARYGREEVPKFSNSQEFPELLPTVRVSTHDLANQTDQNWKLGQLVGNGVIPPARTDNNPSEREQHERSCSLPEWLFSVCAGAIT